LGIVVGKANDEGLRQELKLLKRSTLVPGLTARRECTTLWERTLCATAPRHGIDEAPLSRTGCAPTGFNQVQPLPAVA
jgi:hypothetical protein